MRMFMSTRVMRFATVAAFSLGMLAAPVSFADDKASEAKEELKVKLPKPAFVGTPKTLPAGIKNIEKPTGKPRPAFMAPKGVTNLAAGKSVTSSDKEPIIGKLDQVTDGDKEATDGSWVELGPGLQWVQIDLGKPSEIAAIVVWHMHADPRVYRGVVVQVADDEDFISNVKTIYNNDDENITGLGIGQDKTYFENYEGRLIDAKGAKGRYVRLYSKGNSGDDQNHYTEVEVFGTQK